MKKKLTAFILAVLMVAALVPTTVLAESEAADSVETDSLQCPPGPPPEPELTINIVTYDMNGNQIDIQGGTVSKDVIRWQGKEYWKITAHSANEFYFYEWDGPIEHDKDDNPNYIKRNGNKTVTACFKLRCNYKALTIQIHGEGTVSTDPEGLMIGSKKYFEQYETVELDENAIHGWEFDYWSGTHNGGNRVWMYTDRTVHAHFKKCSYDITFQVGANGKWADNTTADKVVSTEYGVMPDPGVDIDPNEGWEFTGWSPNLVAADGAATYVAQYKQIVYTLDVDVDPAHGGSVTVSPQKDYYTAGETVTLTADAANSGDNRYKFTGWSGDASGTTAATTVTMDANKSVTANFRPKVSPILEFTVDNGDGTYTAHFGYLVRGSEDVSIPAGGSNKFTGGGVSVQDQGQPTTFSAGRQVDVFTVVFDGSDLVWTLDGSTATASTNPSMMRYTLDVDVDPAHGGSVTVSPQKDYYTAGETVTLTADAANSGDNRYKFTGWSGDATAKTATTTVTMDANKSVTANFLHISYTVNFVDFDGVELGKQIILWGKAAVAPVNPTRTGYTFTGWDKAFDNVTGNLTVTAQYEINTFTVKFVDHDGEELKSQTVNWSTAATAPTNPTRTGYSFTGWDKTFDKVTDDLTVTAQYAINTFTVKFVDHDGEELDSQSVNWGTAAIAPTNPTHAGYTFTGWDKAFNNVTDNLTVTAQYKQNETVSLDDSDIPKTYDDSQVFPWWWIVVAAALIGAIVWIIISQARKHKNTGDAV